MSSPHLRTLTDYVIRDSSDPKRHQLLQSEFRWHISQHYFAECKGEEIIEDLAKLTRGKRERTLLKAQLTDEMRHVSLFKSVVDKIGLDERAQRFADRYAALVKSQRTFAEIVIEEKQIIEENHLFRPSLNHTFSTHEYIHTLNQAGYCEINLVDVSKHVFDGWENSLRTIDEDSFNSNRKVLHQFIDAYSRINIFARLGKIKYLFITASSYES